MHLAKDDDDFDQVNGSDERKKQTDSVYIYQVHTSGHRGRRKYKIAHLGFSCTQRWVPLTRIGKIGENKF